MMIKKYKSVTFEAIQVAHDLSNVGEVSNFVGYDVKEGRDGYATWIDLYGERTARANDFIARTDDGDIEIYDHDTFLGFFEEV